MLIVLSPAKSLDTGTPWPERPTTRPAFAGRALELVDVLRERSPADLATLMSISDRLAAENAIRFQNFRSRHVLPSSRPAVYTFDGDVYDGLQARTLSAPAVDWLEGHVRILSGLYGVLRPMDLMQPYRLEMGTRLSNPAGADLYAYWGDAIARELARAMRQPTARRQPARPHAARRQPAARRVLVNLASEEYFRAVDLDALGVRVVQPVFQEWRDGAWKIISFNAKRARGAMTRQACIEAIDDVEALKDFDVDGHRFDAGASNETLWYFRRA